MTERVSWSSRQVRHLGPGFSELQHQYGVPVVLESIGPFSDNDTVVYTVPATEHRNRPPKSVLVMGHDGGLASSAGATRDITDLETLNLRVTEEDGTETDIVHVFDGVSAGAATPAEIVASLVADTAFMAVAMAVTGITSNVVHIMARSPTASIQVTGGDAGALAALGYPLTAANNLARTFSSVTSVITGGTGWSWTYNCSTGVFTLKNETGSAAYRIHAQIQF